MEEVNTQFKKYGYYKMTDIIYNILIDSSNPPKGTMPNYNSDLVVLFLNTNACNNRNIGLMKEKADVGGQLHYIETELLNIEANNKVAWIVGNINPGSKNCNSKWAGRYNTLVERFQKIIRMQLFGHETEEYFQL